jgi:hypothetical protein
VLRLRMHGFSPLLPSTPLYYMVLAKGRVVESQAGKVPLAVCSVQCSGLSRCLSAKPHRANWRYGKCKLKICVFVSVWWDWIDFSALFTLIPWQRVPLCVSTVADPPVLCVTSSAVAPVICGFRVRSGEFESRHSHRLFVWLLSYVSGTRNN